ncbi:MAG: IPT/TIG domain-containing protein [Polyangiaceae bacterium]
MAVPTLNSITPSSGPASGGDLVRLIGTGFTAECGGFTVDADMPLAAMGFFENGGSQLWVVRTIHYGDVSDPSSALGVRASGFLAAGGGPTPASLQGAASGPFRLTDGSLIRAAIDGGRHRWHPTGAERHARARKPNAGRWRHRQHGPPVP